MKTINILGHLFLEAFKYFKLNEHQYIGQGRTYNSGPSREMNNYICSTYRKPLRMQAQEASYIFRVDLLKSFCSNNKGNVQTK